MCTSVKQCWSAALRSLINVMKNAKSTIALTLSNSKILNQSKNVNTFFFIYWNDIKSSNIFNQCHEKMQKARSRKLCQTEKY